MRTSERSIWGFERLFVPFRTDQPILEGVAMSKPTKKWVLVFLVCLSWNVAPEAWAQPVKVGIIGHMGFFSGDHVWRGASLAADEINKGGGVLGRQIELVKVQSNEMVSVPDAASAMEKLLSVDKAAVVIGGFRSEAVLAMQDVACEYKTVFMGITAHFKPFERIAQEYEKYKYYFRPYPNAAYMGATIAEVTATVADVIRKELGVQRPKVAILAEKAIWVDPLARKVREESERIGIEVIGEWKPSAMATDLTAELTAIKASGAHQICSILAGPVGTSFGKQWYELKIPAAMSGINCVAWDSKGYLDATKADYSATWDPGGQARVEMTPKTIRFWDDYQAKWGDGPSFLGADGYDCLYIWKEAVTRAGSFGSDAVVKELEKTEYTGPLGKIVFEQKEHRWPHGGKFGKDFMTYSAIQLVGGKVNNFWPTREWPKQWGIQYPGTVPYQLPPWMLSERKGK
jgi:branched-chain amino acid transport system substrate-binding protein